MNYIVPFLVLLRYIYNSFGNQEIFVQTGDEIKIIEESNSHSPQMNENNIPKLLPDIMEIWEYDEFHNSVTHSQSYALPIRFEPLLLEFFERSLGIPHTAEVIVTNESPNKAIHLNAISGNSIHFHPSFFKEKVLEPGYNTSFMVTFLAREIGNVENSLIVHTSVGQFKYQVFGTGIENPYRVRAHYDGRIPLNTIFSPIINIFNPHTRPIQVTEVFASSGDFHMELPYGFGLTSSQIWKIDPFETKPLVISNFLGRLMTNNTCYLAIKVEIAAEQQKSASNKLTPSAPAAAAAKLSGGPKYSLPIPPPLMIIPFDIQVVSEPGLYSSVDMLDFGTLSTYDTPKVIKLKVYNLGPSTVHISSVTGWPTNEALSIDFSPIKIPANTKKPIIIASVTFLAFKAMSPKHWSGKIKVYSKSGPSYKLTVPYTANVLKGALLYDHNNTKIYVSGFETEPIRKYLALQNTFDFPLAVSRIAFEKDLYNLFKISKHPKPLVIPAKQSYNDLYIEYRPKKSFDLRQKEKKMYYLTSSLSIHTNASKFKIPINIYYGGIHALTYALDSQKLTFGYIPCGSSKNLILSLVNYNPYDVEIRGIRVDQAPSAENVRDMGSSPVGAQIFLALMEEITNASFTLQDSMAKIMFPITQDIESLFPQPISPILSPITDTSQMTKMAPNTKVELKPFQVAHFIVQATAPQAKDGGSSGANIIVESTNSLRPETSVIPFTLSYGRGEITLYQPSVPLPPGPELSPAPESKNLLDMSDLPSYPGKVSKRNLLLYSRFDHEVTVTQVVGYLNDPYPVYEYTRPKNRRLALLPNAFGYVGQIRLDPRKACEIDDTFCYLGLGVSDAEYDSWCSLLASPNDMVDVDLPLYERNRAKWNELREHGLDSLNSSFLIGTNEHDMILAFVVKGKLTWPKLVTQEELSFPLTKVGNYSAAVVILRNPTYLPLLLHIVPLSLVTNGPDRLLKSLFPGNHTEFDIEQEPQLGTKRRPSLELAEINLEDDQIFFDSNGSLDPTDSNSGRRSLETLIGHKPHPSTLGYVLKPNQEARFLVKFSPYDAIERVSYLVVRNNLTILEAIKIRGRGGSGKLELVDLSTMETQGTLISFHLIERHLKNCFGPQNTLQAYTLRKTFIAKNTGDMALTVRATRINDVACQAFGFRVLDCAQTPFTLEPNESRRMDLAFTPDFSVSKVTRFLEIDLDGAGTDAQQQQPIRFVLMATVPPILLSLCSSKIVRPDWEIILYYSTLGSMAVLFLFVVFVSWVEADRISRFHWLSQSLDRLRATRTHSANSSVHKSEPAVQNRKIVVDTTKPLHPVVSSDTPPLTNNGTAPPLQATPVSPPTPMPPVLTHRRSKVIALTPNDPPAIVAKLWSSEEGAGREDNRKSSTSAGGRKGGKNCRRGTSRDEEGRKSLCEEESKGDKVALVEKTNVRYNKKHDGDTHKSKKWVEPEASTPKNTKKGHEEIILPTNTHKGVGLTKANGAVKKPSIANTEAPPQQAPVTSANKKDGGGKLSLKRPNKSPSATAQAAPPPPAPAKNLSKPRDQKISAAGEKVASPLPTTQSSGTPFSHSLRSTTSTSCSKVQVTKAYSQPWNTAPSLSKDYNGGFRASFGGAGVGLPIQDDTGDKDTQTFSQLISSWNLYQQSFQTPNIPEQPPNCSTLISSKPNDFGSHANSNAWADRSFGKPIYRVQPTAPGPVTKQGGPRYSSENVRSLTPTNVSEPNKSNLKRYTNTPTIDRDGSISNSDSRSHTPVWDLPESGKGDADFGALSEQTMKFDKQFASQNPPGGKNKFGGPEFSTFSLFPNTKLDEVPISTTDGIEKAFGVGANKWSWPDSLPGHKVPPSGSATSRHNSNNYKFNNRQPASTNDTGICGNINFAWNFDSNVRRYSNIDNANPAAHNMGSTSTAISQSQYSYEYPDASRTPLANLGHSPRKGGDSCLSRSSSWDSIVAEVQNEKSRMESYVATQQLHDQFAIQQNATATFYSLLQSYLDDPGFQEYLQQQRKSENGPEQQQTTVRAGYPLANETGYYNMQVPYDQSGPSQRRWTNSIRMPGGAGDYFNLRLPTNVFPQKENETSEQTLKNIRQKCEDWLFSINAPPFKPGSASPGSYNRSFGSGGINQSSGRFDFGYGGTQLPSPPPNIPQPNPRSYSGVLRPQVSNKREGTIHHTNLADIWRKHGDL